MDDASSRLAALSGSARRLLDYVAALDGAAGYAVLRHLARITEEDMVEDLKECVAAGALAPVAGEPNTYAFAGDAVRALVLAEAGDERLAKQRARAQAARRRVG